MNSPSSPTAAVATQTAVNIPERSMRPSKENFTYLVQPSTLRGQVHISGAKNSVLRLLAASLLTGEDIKIHNYPATLRDAQIHIGMLETLGKNCHVDEGTILISEKESPKSQLIWGERSIRNTLLILGALVARTGQGSVPLPGGCNLGDRKFDLHEMVLQRLGASVWVENDQLCAEAKHGLKGADIHLPIRSTGATENAIICGTLAQGVTRIWNPHIRPEIVDLIRYLRGMGANIEVYGQEHIQVTGVDGLGGVKHSVIPDNMEAITWLAGAVITGGDVEIVNFPFQDLEVPLIYLRESGAQFYRGDNSLIVRGGRCYPVEISTGPYPGINSDMQPIFAVYGAFAKGESRIIDLRFPGRYAYAHELAKLGVNFEIDGNMLKIQGGNPLQGATVQALDLRAGVALALAGLKADGATYIENAWQIERGYDNYVAKLRTLGGHIDYA